MSLSVGTYSLVSAVHRGASLKFPFPWIYGCHSGRSTGKETGKMHLCAGFGFTVYLISHYYSITNECFSFCFTNIVDTIMNEVLMSFDYGKYQRTESQALVLVIVRKTTEFLTAKHIR